MHFKNEVHSRMASIVDEKYSDQNIVSSHAQHITPSGIEINEDTYTDNCLAKTLVLYIRKHSIYILHILQIWAQNSLKRAWKLY